MFFTDLFGKYRNSIAIITPEGLSMSYGDLLDYSGELYSKINHRCLVFSLCRNTPDSLCGYLSFLANRVVPLLLDDSIDSELLDGLISVYKPEYIWLPESRTGEFADYSLVYKKDEYSLVRLERDRYFEIYDELALLLTTSGSTGSPKLVRISYSNLEANARSIIEYLGITDQSRPITTMPMSYSFGLSVINTHLLQGATILLTTKTMMEGDFWAFLKREKANTMSGVPYSYEVLKKLRFFKMDLPYLTTLTQAGGKLNPDLNREFVEYCRATGKRFFVMYGQTEATARMSYLPHEFALEKIGSMGHPIPGGEFYLIDDNNNYIDDPETVGELVYKGKNVSLGYAEKGEDLSRGDDNNGLLITGDLAKRDSDNFYYIVGRKKRFIKLFGNRVNLDETERLLKNIVPDCACVGEDDRMIVFITNSEHENHVLEYLTKKTGINVNGFLIKLIDTIPKNSSGKTIYSALPLK